MKITVEDLAPCRKLLRVEVDAQAVDETFAKITTEYLKHGRVSGFRAGKAPKSMILQAYGKEIEKGAKEELMRNSLRQGIKENEFDVVETLGVEEIQFGQNQPFEFTATLEILPKFALPEYKGLPVKIPSRGVTDEDVVKALDLLRNQKATFNTVEREAHDGDILVTNFTGTVEGKPLIEVAPTAKGLTEQKNYWLEIKPGSFIPGFADQLKGAKAGEKRTVNIEFEKDFVVPELVGNKAVYEVEIVEVKERVLPPLDEAFAKSYSAESLEKLRDGVRHDLEQDLERRKKELTHSQIAETLLKSVQFDVPELLLKQEIKSEVYGLVQENQRRGVSPQLIEEKKDQIFDRASSTAATRLRLNIMLTRIAEQEKIKVTPEELQSQIFQMAVQNQTPPIKYFQELEKKGSIPGIHEQMVFHKTIEFLVKNASIEEVAPPAAS